MAECQTSVGPHPLNKLLSAEKAFCYICRGILIEPVTLPCAHVFCKFCFDKSLEETSYSCPLCRRRISTWVRSARKNKNLVDSGLWSNIQQQFGKEVKKKMAGEEDGLDQQLRMETDIPRVLAKNGDIQKEFAEMTQAAEEVTRKRERQAELESLALIAQLEREEREKETNVTIVQVKTDSNTDEADFIPEPVPAKKVRRSNDKMSTDIPLKKPKRGSSVIFQKVSLTQTDLTPADKGVLVIQLDQTTLEEHLAAEQRLLQEKLDWKLAVRMSKGWVESTYSLRGRPID